MKTKKKNPSRVCVFGLVIIICLSYFKVFVQSFKLSLTPDSSSQLILQFIMFLIVNIFGGFSANY